MVRNGSEVALGGLVAPPKPHLPEVSPGVTLALGGRGVEGASEGALTIGEHREAA